MTSKNKGRKTNIERSKPVYREPEVIRFRLKEPLLTFYFQIAQGCEVCDDTTTHWMDKETGKIFCGICGHSYHPKDRWAAVLARRANSSADLSKMIVKPPGIVAYTEINLLML